MRITNRKLIILLLKNNILGKNFIHLLAVDLFGNDGGLELKDSFLSLR